MANSGARADGWRKSTFSGNTGCVEVSVDGEAVCIRDSKHPAKDHLRFDRAEWQAFLLGVKDGQFELPE